MIGRVFLAVFLTATGVAAQQGVDSARTVPAPEERRVIVRLIEAAAYRPCMVFLDGDSSSSIESKFRTVDAAPVIHIRYQGGRGVFRAAFSDSGVSIDTSESGSLSLVSKRYSATQNTLELRVGFPEKGWQVAVRSGEIIEGSPVSLALNSMILGETLRTGPTDLPLQEDINAILFVSTGRYRSGEVLIRYSRFSEPRIIDIRDIRAEMHVDTAARRARLTVWPHLDAIGVSVATGVRHAHCTIRNLHTGKTHEIHATDSIDHFTLAAAAPYEVVLQKRGYPVKHAAFATAYSDSLITVQWRPISRTGVVLRSAALPGWGQRYSERRGRFWWWSAAIATAAGGAVAAADRT